MGVLDIGGELTPWVSGESPLGNYAASGHVEGQAALIMRERGVSTAELLIDLTGEPEPKYRVGRQARARASENPYYLRDGKVEIYLKAT